MNIFERKKIRIKTKSPIHIGSAYQKLTRFEFIQKEQWIYPISEERLSKFLLEKNLVDSYVSSIEEKGGDFNLLEIFKGISLKEVEKLSMWGKIKVFNNSKIEDFKPFIRDGFGVPYIPGTSIKGVIRTAILYNALKTFKNQHPDRFKEEVENEIDIKIRDNNNKKNFFQWGNERWLQNFVLNNSDNKSHSPSPNTDWLRMLQVSDAYPLSSIQTTIIPANILKKESTWKYRTELPGQETSIYLECIPENTIFEFEAMWDKKLLDDFKRHIDKEILLPTNLDEMFKMIDEWAKDIFSFEKEFFRGHSLARWYEANWHKNKCCPFRVGFGSGMISTTILMLLSEDLRKKIRNKVGVDRKGDIAPKSRRVWKKDDKNLLPFGWALIEIEPFSEIVQENMEKQLEESSPSTLDEKKINVKLEIEKATEIWEGANLKWEPGRKVIVVQSNKGKAELKCETHDSIVPQAFHKKLFDKKESVKAKVTVEKEGNKYTVLKIE